jgi:oligopeptide transport system permease protein
MDHIKALEFAPHPENLLDEVYESRPKWRETVSMFTKNKGAVISLVFLLIIIAVSLIGPLLSGYRYDAVDLTRQNLPPRIPVVEKLGIFNGVLDGEDKYAVKNCKDQYFWFGTDKLGRDLFTRFCCGTQISLLIGAISAVLNMLIGVTYGLVSGYYGGKLDIMMQRFLEVLNGIPGLVIVSLLVIVLKPGILSIIVAMAISQWTVTARLTRANTLRLKEMEHIMASRTLGVGTGRILFKEIFPNLLSTVIVMCMLSIPGAIFMEAFLSFVGLGIPNPQASLGSLVNDGFQNMLLYPYQLAIPAVFFALLMLALNIIGDGLRDALDPTMKRV